MAQRRQTAPSRKQARALIGGVLAAGSAVLWAGSMVVATPAGISFADESTPPASTVVPPPTETTVPPPPPPPTTTVPPPPPPTTVPPPPVGNGKGIGPGGIPGAIGGPGNKPVPPGSVLSELAKLPGSQPDAIGIQPGQAVKGLTPGADNGSGPNAP